MSNDKNDDKATEVIPTRSQARAAAPAVKEEPMAEETPPKATGAFGELLRQQEAKATTGVRKPGSKAPDLSGFYRVKEGYNIAHGGRQDAADGTVGKHAHAMPGHIVYLSHEEAFSIIKNTKDAKKSNGMPHGPAIESEKQYNDRMEAERANQEFMAALSEGIPTVG